MTMMNVDGSSLPADTQAK